MIAEAVMQALIAMLEKATEGSREHDGEIALACGIYKAWLSKHRYWNFEGPDGKRFIWPDASIPEYDSGTGKKIVLTDKPWSDWVWHANDLPAFSTSLDAALTLVPDGYGWSIDNTGYTVVTRSGLGFLSGRGEEEWHGKGKTPALSSCIAALRARAAGEG